MTEMASQQTSFSERGGNAGMQSGISACEVCLLLSCVVLQRASALHRGILRHNYRPGLALLLRHNLGFLFLQPPSIIPDLGTETFSLKLSKAIQVKFSGKCGIRGQWHKRKAGNPCRCTGSQESQLNKVLLVPQVPHRSLASWMDAAKLTQNTPALRLCCPRCPREQLQPCLQLSCSSE